MPPGKGYKHGPKRRNPNVKGDPLGIRKIKKNRQGGIATAPRTGNSRMGARGLGAGMTARIIRRKVGTRTGKSRMGAPGTGRFLKSKRMMRRRSR